MRTELRTEAFGKGERKTHVLPGKRLRPFELLITWQQRNKWRVPLNRIPVNHCLALRSFSRTSPSCRGRVEGQVDLSNRIEEAKKFLLNPHYTPAEIADELGFASVGDLDRAFEKVAGERVEKYQGRLRSSGF